MPFKCTSTPPRTYGDGICPAVPGEKECGGCTFWKEAAEPGERKLKCPYLVAIEGHSGDGRHLPRAAVNCNGKYTTYYNDAAGNPHPKIEQHCHGDFQACESFKCLEIIRHEKELETQAPVPAGELKPIEEILPGQESQKAVCRICGCDDEHACEGGCHWVEPDLCSRCDEIMKQEKKKEEVGEGPDPVQEEPETEKAPVPEPGKKPRSKKAPAEKKSTKEVPPAKETVKYEATGDPVIDAHNKIVADIDDGAIAYKRVIGSFLLQHLDGHPEDAARILAPGKNIDGTLGEMRKEAQKQASGSCGVLTDEEGFAIVLKYFGIDGGAPPRPAPPEPQKPTPPPPSARPAASFDISLDDLL